MALDRGGVLKDLESKNSILERQNFDLKMQIYYLNEKLGGAEGAAAENAMASFVEARDASVASLKDANRGLAKRVAELELDLKQAVQQVAQAQAQVQALTTTGAGKSSANDLAMLDENRHRERTAMKTIAEHDAVIIQQLEDSVKSLQAQHQNDMVLLSGCTDKITGLIEELEKKEVTILAQADQIYSLEQQCNTYNERVKQQEQMLVNWSVGVNGIRGGDDTLLSRATTMNGTEQDKPNPAFASQTFSSPSRRWAATSPSSSKRENISSRDFLDFGVKQAWEELHALRLENKSLADELDKRDSLIKTQEEALRRVRNTVEDVAMLEAEEIARLEAQLETTLAERNALQKKCRDLEVAFKINKTKADDLEIRYQNMEVLQDELITMVSDLKEEAINNRVPASTPISPHSFSFLSTSAYNRGNDEVVRMYRSVANAVPLSSAPPLTPHTTPHPHPITPIKDHESLSF